MSTGLDESVIRAIPIVQFKRVREEFDEKRNISLCECAVCLNEFRGEEKIRILPGCSHLFHIDCIDVWLQSNANCPLCRTSISVQPHSIPAFTQLPTPPRGDPDRFTDHRIDMDDNFVTIEVRNNGDPELPNTTHQSTSPINNSSIRKLDQSTGSTNLQKKAKKLNWVSSMSDEIIDVRTKDDGFSVQPIRRSISMDSSADRQLLLSVQEALQQQSRQCSDISGTSEGCTSSSNINNRMRRSLFSFGSGRALSKSAVLPVEFNKSKI
ncbi:hypothetical protein Syun_006646 [Stephania yunnanensis]|uniref:RING-type E3 ubiquitin transferase n=1 Tax=Stephania yunnanensis TaxID=152371 RepID=A0AAP0KZL3_9MAGN